MAYLKPHPHAVADSAELGTDDLFTSVPTWATFVIIATVALAVVWRFRRKFDVQTGLTIGLCLFVGLWLIVFAFRFGYIIGARDGAETSDAAPIHDIVTNSHARPAMPESPTT